MSQFVVTGAVCMCSQGIGPSTLSVLPTHLTNISGSPGGNITDNAPFVNIPPFPLCNSSSNPTVIAATAAALGVHTPSACVPVFAAPWSGGSSTVMVSGSPALNATSTLSCTYGGSVSISFAGQVTVNVPS